MTIIKRKLTKNANKAEVGKKAKKFQKTKQYTNEVEKKLLVDNIRLAVEVYGKDFLRKHFKTTKPKNTYNQN